jgi:hypothetical protein
MRALRHFLGRQFVTLEDAAACIMKLPKAEQDLEEWQTAVGCLIGAAEGRDFLMHARIGMLRALNRHVGPKWREYLLCCSKRLGLHCRQHRGWHQCRAAR